MLIVARSMCEVDRLKSLLYKEFEMKYLSASKKILGMQICRGRGGNKAVDVSEKLY